MADRHPTPPLQPVTEEELRVQCVMCGVPELHSRTYRRSALHAGGDVAQRLFPEQPQRGMSVEDVVAFLRQEPPDLLKQVRGHVGDALLDMD